MDDEEIELQENFEAELRLPTYLQLFTLQEFSKTKLDLHKIILSSFFAVKEECNDFEMDFRFSVASVLKKPSENNICFLHILQGTDCRFSIDVWHRQIDAILDRLYSAINQFFPQCPSEELFVVMCNFRIDYTKRAKAG
jgi:hypothetical protein